MQTVRTASTPVAAPKSAPLWPYAAVIAIYATAIAVLASSLRQHFGFPLDDSWIHQTIGRNFAEFHSLGFLPHQRSSGSTSLLWTILVSLNYTVLPALSPVLYCLAVNTLCLLAIALILLRLALRDGMHPALAVLWAAAPAADGNFVWLAFTGMEHLTFIALSLAAILFWLPHSNPRRSVPTALLASLCMGLLCVTRPEGIVLPVLLIAGFRLFRRSLREASFAALITLALAVLPFTVNLITSGALLPVTFKGRQWMYFAGQSPGLEYRVQLFEQWVTRPVKAILVFDGSFAGATARHLVLAGVAVLFGLCAVGLYTLVRGKRTATLIVCAWAAIHTALYLVILPVSGHGGRYQPFLLLLVTPLAVLGLYYLFRALTPRGADGGTATRAVLACAAILVAVLGVRSLTLWHTVLADGIDHIHDSHGAMAAYIESQHLTEPIAVFDIGRIGYELHGNLVDLGGLTDASYVAYLYGNRVPAYLREHDIHLVVLPGGAQGSIIGQQLRISDNPEVVLKPLHLDCTPVAIWTVGWVETRHAAQCQQLYRMTFAGK